MTFTIIIPYYEPFNGFFIKALQSIFAQTYNNYECIIVSSEKEKNSLLLTLKSLGSNNVKIIYCNDIDQSSKRNYGIQEAQGDYLLFLDSDDMLEDNYLLFSKIIIDRCQPDLILYGMTRKIEELSYENEFINKLNTLDNNELILDYFFKSETKKKYINDQDIINDSAWGKVFKKDIIKSNNLLFPIIKCAEDAIFVKKYISFANYVITCGCYKSYYWRINGESTMNDPFSGFFDIGSFFAEYDKLMDKLPQYQNDKVPYYSMLFEKRLAKLLGFYYSNTISIKKFIFVLKKYNYRTIINRNICIKLINSIIVKISCLLIKTKCYFLLTYFIVLFKLFRNI